jgi:hypothetical protein
MAIIGRDLVALIQGTLESNSRKDQQEIREDLAKPAADLLKPFGLESRAVEVFDVLRRYEVKFDSRDGGIQRERAVSEEFMSWGVPSFSEANRLADALHDLYKDKPRSRFLNTRSITAHVGAILRPFKRRYRDGWADAGINNFDLEATVAEVERLNGMVVSNEAELLAWSKLVYALFLKVAVLGEDAYKPGVSSEQKPRRPLGMISSTSERTYRQQWTSWIDENLKKLLSDAPRMGSFEIPGSGQSPDISFNQGVRDAVYDPYVYPNAPVQPLAPAVTSASPVNAVAVRLTDVSDASLSAERVWADRSVASRELGAWVANLVLFWGQARTVTIHLEFASPAGDSKLTLPATMLEGSAERIVAVLNSYV